MSQQINLLNTSLIRPRDWLSLRNVGIIYVVAGVVMYWYYSSMQQQAAELNEARNAKVAAFEAAQLELQAASSQASRVINTKEQEQELQVLLQKKEMQGKLLSTFKHVQDDAGHHILDYMVGFAAQPLKGVWITGFKLNAFDQNMSLTGRALQADQVPAFIERLGEAPVFKGKLFSGLTLKEVSQADNSLRLQEAATVSNDQKPATDQSPVAGTAPLPGKADASITQVKQATPRAPLTLIEFEVKGQDSQNDDAQSLGEGTGLPIAGKREPQHG